MRAGRRFCGDEMKGERERQKSGPGRITFSRKGNFLILVPVVIVIHIRQPFEYFPSLVRV